MANKWVQLDDQPYRDARGDWSCGYNVCVEHGWQDRRLRCPWPECNERSKRWPLYILYEVAGFGSGRAEVSLGGKFTYIAERKDREKTWNWVEYVPKGDFRK